MILSWLLEWVGCLDGYDISTLITVDDHINDIDDDIIQSVLLLASSLSKNENDSECFNKIKIFLSNTIIVELIRSLILVWDGYKNPDMLEWQAISRLSIYMPYIFTEKQQIYEKLIILLNIELKGLIDSSDNDSTWRRQTSPRFRRRLKI